MNTIFNVSSKRSFLRRWAGQFNLTVINIQGGLGLAPANYTGQSVMTIIYHYTPETAGGKKYNEYYKFLKEHGLFNRKHEHVEHPLYQYQNGLRSANTHPVGNAA